jgi:hypothetical protein
MIRRILHAELSDVRALAREARRLAVNAIHHAVFVDRTDAYGVFIVGRSTGAGYIVDDPHADNWPDGARLLTIGRVTLAAWGRARKAGAT